tara:strand:- start:568 stop:861 length:294 start_codon:yes stop_codon:yes gene_type:complete
MLSKINRYNCKITQNGVELHNKDYISLKDISNELGLSYHIVANISSNRKPNKKTSNFIYFPKIEIVRLELDYNEIEKEKKERKQNKSNNIIDNTEDY